MADRKLPCVRSKFVSLLLTFSALLLCSTACGAQARCLWLNAATAGGILGGDVAMTVTPLTTGGDETCEFTRTQGSSVSTLRIEVHTMETPARDFAMYLAQCGGVSTPLIRIGNEAVQCLSKAGSPKMEEQVIGRVRERAFVLTIRRNLGNGMSKEPLRDDIRNIAEQVAGSLF